MAIISRLNTPSNSLISRGGKTQKRDHRAVNQTFQTEPSLQNICQYILGRYSYLYKV